MLYKLFYIHIAHVHGLRTLYATPMYSSNATSGVESIVRGNIITRAVTGVLTVILSIMSVNSLMDVSITFVFDSLSTVIFSLICHQYCIGLVTIS